MSDILLSAANLNTLDKNSQYNKIISESVQNKSNNPTVNQPKNSIGSNDISIVTLDENGSDSSVIDSDSESDADEEINCNEIAYKSSIDTQSVKNFKLQNIGQSSDLWTNDDVKPNVGNICVQNSSDIIIGGNKVFHGPVTINHYVHDNGTVTNRNSSTENLSQNEQSSSAIKENPNLIQKFQNKWKWTKNQVIVVTIAGGIIVCLLISIVIILATFNASIESNSDTTGSLQIISRKDWGAEPPKVALDELKLPVDRVIIHHTGNGHCYTRDDCILIVKFIQRLHQLNNSWNDIGYNFLVGGDGAVYVGRGWNFEGAHTGGFNEVSIGVAFIGRFDDSAPLKRQLNAVQKLFEEGLELEKLDKNYKLFGHCQLGKSVIKPSPGSALFRIIKTWNHWSSDPIGACKF